MVLTENELKNLKKLTYNDLLKKIESLEATIKRLKNPQRKAQKEKKLQQLLKEAQARDEEILLCEHVQRINSLQEAMKKLEQENFFLALDILIDIFNNQKLTSEQSEFLLLNLQNLLNGKIKTINLHEFFIQYPRHLKFYIDHCTDFDPALSNHPHENRASWEKFEEQCKTYKLLPEYLPTYEDGCLKLDENGDPIKDLNYMAQLMQEER